VDDETTYAYRTIALSDVDYADRPLRGTIGEFLSLHEKLAEEDQLEPIKVIENGGRYFVIDGVRRCLARHLLGRKYIEALVIPLTADAARKVLEEASVFVVTPVPVTKPRPRPTKRPPAKKGRRKV
jgi:ParB-like chromosome segregation protein Spo0J